MGKTEEDLIKQIQMRKNQVRKSVSGDLRFLIST